MYELNNCFYFIRYDYFDELLWLKNVIFKVRKDSLHSCHHNLDIVSKAVYTYCIDYVLNIEVRQYNIKINLAIATCHFILEVISRVIRGSEVKSSFRKDKPTSFIVMRACTLHGYAADSVSWVGFRKDICFVEWSVHSRHALRCGTAGLIDSLIGLEIGSRKEEGKVCLGELPKSESLRWA